MAGSLRGMTSGLRFVRNTRRDPEVKLSKPVSSPIIKPRCKSGSLSLILLSPLSDASGFVGITSLTPYTGSSSSTATDLGMQLENMRVIVTIDSEVAFGGITITKLQAASKRGSQKPDTNFTECGQCRMCTGRWRKAPGLRQPWSGFCRWRARAAAPGKPLRCLAPAFC